MALIQAPKAIVMIRPWHFHPNPETAGDNAFQRRSPTLDINVSEQARMEFDCMAKTLEHLGVRVHIFDDYGEQETPDSVFPNNWFSTHHGGHVAIYPMYSPSRRRERRDDVINMLKAEYRVQDVIDFSGLEWDDLFLEGTGAMVLDHVERIAYCANSLRANPIILERFCAYFHYEPMAFDAVDDDGKPIYHTNVMMTIASDYVLIGSYMIQDASQRKRVIDRLKSTGRTIIEINRDQIHAFVGNAIELKGSDGTFLALSKNAYNALTIDQREVIKKTTPIVPLDVSTIELAGGSVRCMIAGIHLSHRNP